MDEWKDGVSDKGSPMPALVGFEINYLRKYFSWDSSPAAPLFPCSICRAAFKVGLLPMLQGRPVWYLGQPI